MAVVNQYLLCRKLADNTDNTNGELNPFGTGNPLVSETYVIKSILVTSAGTPSVTVTNDGAFTTIKSAAINCKYNKRIINPTVNSSRVVTTLTIKAGSADSFDFWSQLSKHQKRGNNIMQILEPKEIITTISNKKTGEKV